MVAYSYKGRFVAPIRVGLGLAVRDEDRELGSYQPGQIIKPKRQTVRSNGKKRHARPGETVQLYHAQRSPKCFKIGEGRCSQTSAIRIFVEAGRIVINPNCDHEVVYSRAKQLDSFAQSDGFQDWPDMQAFWRDEHGDLKKLGPFVGVLIEWVPL